jgi:hypothetical protein
VMQDMDPLERPAENIGAVAVELTSRDLRDIESAASKITIQGVRYPDPEDMHKFFVKQMTGR